MSSKSDKRAAVFPGQGAHDFAMLDGVREMPDFAARYRLVGEILGVDLDAIFAAADREALNQNATSSLLTVLASSLALDRFRAEFGEPAAVAGYSVGQWSALYAAGMVPFEGLMRIVHTRATLMSACVAEKKSGMVAVIGLPDATVQAAVDELRAAGHEVEIANFNCVGQVTLAAEAAAIAPTIAAFADLKAKKVAELPVAGGWHSRLLEPAVEPFFEFLRDVNFSAPRVPIADNVTGDWLPTADETALKRQVARHLSRPVRWADCVKKLLARGCTEFVEVGFGSVLTRFGFFIDRAVTHRALLPEPRGGRPTR